MRKILLLLIFSFLAILAACNPAMGSVSQEETRTTIAEPRATLSTPSSTPQPVFTPTSNPLLQVPLEDLNNLQISFWHPWSGELAQTMEAIIQDFNNSNVWGIHVITTPYGGSASLANSIEENMGANNLPNVVVSSSEQLLQWEDQYQLFTDLNLYIADGQWGLTRQEQADIPQTYWDQDNHHDKQIGIPALRNMHVLFYNKSWGEELGYTESPQTFKNFSDQICAAAAERKDIDETGGWIINTDPLTTYSWLTAAGLTNLYDPEKDVYQFNTPGALEVLSKLKSLSIKGCIWNARLPNPYDYFAGRQTLMYSGTLTDILPQTAAMQKQQNADDWLIQPYPAGSQNSSVVVNGSSYAVLETTPAEQLASWLFLRWLVLPRHQAALSSASGCLPVSGAAFDEMQAFTSQYPQWAAASEWIPLANSAPHAGSWTIVQNLLEDAAWQSFQTYTAQENIPGLLEQLDAMIPEILSNNKMD
ncbi:MAG: extracellular solute-binding protein [Chloroflexi bacterium]|nr:extracellular solute-binding protein [Chloroflexota bacterium]